jgi:hypothetical protein
VDAPDTVGDLCPEFVRQLGPPSPPPPAEEEREFLRGLLAQLEAAQPSPWIPDPFDFDRPWPDADEEEDED